MFQTNVNVIIYCHILCLVCLFSVGLFVFSRCMRRDASPISQRDFFGSCPKFIPHLYLYTLFLTCLIVSTFLKTLDISNQKETAEISGIHDEPWKSLHSQDGKMDRRMSTEHLPGEHVRRIVGRGIGEIIIYWLIFCFIFYGLSTFCGLFKI